MESKLFNGRTNDDAAVLASITPRGTVYAEHKSIRTVYAR